MAHVFHLQQAYRRTLGGVRATIRAILSAVTAEHTLALRAATKAALPRQSLAEVRAMYVSSPQEPRQEDDAIAQSTKFELIRGGRRGTLAERTPAYVSSLSNGTPATAEEIAWHLDRGQSHRSTRFYRV